MPRSKLKLYVWEQVLCDYTCGMVCVLAHNEEEAWKLLKEKDWRAYEMLRGINPEDIERPRVVDKPEAFVVWGGG